MATNAEEAGRSDWSAKHEYTSPPGKPSAPQSFNKQSSTKNSITVNWEAPPSNGGSPIENYIIQYKLVSEENED